MPCFRLQSQISIFVIVMGTDGCFAGLGNLKKKKKKKKPGTVVGDDRILSIVNKKHPHHMSIIERILCDNLQNGDR